MYSLKSIGKSVGNSSRPFRVGLLLTAGACLLPATAGANGYFEVSGGFSFSKSTYGANSYQWTRRWGGSFGYHLNETSEIEFSCQDVVSRNYIAGYEDTTFHDQIFGINWVQSFVGKSFPVQPYIKVGIGQLNRDASGTYAFGGAPPAIYDTVTGILGAGIRIYLTKTFAIRSEVTTYLDGGNIQTWQNNVGFTGGISYYF